jgi:Zinc finger C-x8-C-x5-C-x3-H type (and similar)
MPPKKGGGAPSSKASVDKVSFLAVLPLCDGCSRVIGMRRGLLLVAARVTPPSDADTECLSPSQTFGMKNKKGAKAQQQVKVIQQQQAQMGKSKEVLAREKQREAEKKAKAEADKIRQELQAQIPIVQPKVPFGVDPKTMTCEFWRAGRCDKGTKCKYAHSEEANRKAQKKDLYVDTREAEVDEKERDTMDQWDREKLDKVILNKHGNVRTTTDKVCKYFLQAVEDGKYGWFWECQNGQNCMYKHALPPGFGK